VSEVGGAGPPASRGSIDASLLSEALRSVRMPVAVVTAHLDGRPHGATVSAFSALSRTPPLVLVALEARSALLPLLRDAGVYGINVLATGQQGLATALTEPGPGSFDGIGWTLDTGTPRIDGAASWMVCRLEDLLPGGDHLIAVGRVVHAEAGNAEPLLRGHLSSGTPAGLTG
jgi:flavin reductase (DIM6/NTAB) family NADH-FMN oxidoreductase RutF